MSRSISNYTDMLQGLAPRGAFWTRNTDSVFYQLFEALAVEFNRVDERIDDLTTESFPTSTVELITEYENEFEITPAVSDLSTRQQIVHAKKNEIGSMNAESYISFALSLGYDITIETFTPFWMGLPSLPAMIGIQSNLFYWLILVDADGDRGGFDPGFECGFLSSPANDESYVVNMKRAFYSLITEIDKKKPAHTIVLYDFNNRGFSRGFSWGFECIPFHDGHSPLEGYDFGFDTGFSGLETESTYVLNGGKYLAGGFHHGFSLGFHAHNGGGIEYDGFDTGFHRPA